MTSKDELLLKNCSNLNFQIKNFDEHIKLAHSSNPAMSLDLSNENSKQLGRPLSMPLQNIVVEKLPISPHKQNVESQKLLENKIPLNYKFA